MLVSATEQSESVIYIHVSTLFFSFIFISWRLITLQYCSGFCHTLTWISHGVTCIPHPDPPSHLPLTRFLWVFHSFLELVKHDPKWANAVSGIDRLAPHRVTTNLQFVKTAISLKHNKTMCACAFSADFILLSYASKLPFVAPADYLSSWHFLSVLFFSSAHLQLEFSSREAWGMPRFMKASLGGCFLGVSAGVIGFTGSRSLD